MFITVDVRKSNETSLNERTGPSANQCDWTNISSAPARKKLDVDEPVQDPWARIIGDEADRNVIPRRGQASANSVPTQRINIVVYRTSCTPYDGKRMLIKELEGFVSLKRARKNVHHANETDATMVN